MEEIEEGSILPFEQPTQDDATGAPNNEPDLSKENSGQELSDQVSVDPIPLPTLMMSP